MTRITSVYVICFDFTVNPDGISAEKQTMAGNDEPRYDGEVGASCD